MAEVVGVKYSSLSSYQGNVFDARLAATHLVPPLSSPIF